MYEKDPIHKKTAILDSSSLVWGRYNPGTGMLIIDPNDSVSFIYNWNLIDDNGFNLKNLFNYNPDPACSLRFIAAPEIFVLSGEMKIFERTNTAVAEKRQFQFRHIREYVSPRDCP